jgi:DNA polymerase-3 subunit alpha
MPSPDFVHLHVHTQYSLLDGANQIDRLVQQAKGFNMPALAITDHGNLFGAIDFYLKATKAGIKPIIGCEMYLAPRSRFDREASSVQDDSYQDSGSVKANPYYHLILLAADITGYKNLIKLVSRAHLEGFYYKPRIDKELLSEFHEGLIATSGCLRGEVPYLLNLGLKNEAKAAAGVYQEIFGRDNFYIELQDNGLEKQTRINKELVQLSKELSIPLVATNDCHYLHREDAKSHDLLLCLQTGKTVNEPDRMRFGTDQLYFKSTEEMLRAFDELPQAVRSTQQIAEQVNLKLAMDKLHLPQYQVPSGYTRESYLEKLTKEGFADRLKQKNTNANVETYQQRLAQELSMISAMGYAGYFLIVWDIINYARANKIPVGPGRGSSAGSLVAYALKITDIDPLPYGLLFERFLNPERVSQPDIDMDFCMDRREEVMSYVTEKYGSDHVAQIITFGTMAAKAVVRDVGRAMEIPYADVDRVAKLIPNTLNITLEEALSAEPKLRELSDTDPKIKELLTTARSLEGLARHASTHAAGVVISEEPLTDHVPLYRGAKGEIVTQYAKDEIEKIGLVKFDLLGLRTLTVIDHAVKLIQHRHSISLDPSALPLDDRATYEHLSTNNPVGIFQLESTGMRSLLTKLKPEEFTDLVAILALYRPGPIGSGMVDDFIKRKRGQVPIVYETPQLEEILKETYGVIVYQEQVMRVANELAGFSLGQADILRRAMGKKLPEEMEKQKELFVKGAKKKGITEKKARTIFDRMAYFAGYGFNKSHSAAYALISYQTAYLKTHYPIEFMTALLTSEMGNTDKILRYITECREIKIPVLPPDVNESHSDFTAVENGIRFGLGAIKNVGVGAIDSILEARNQHGRFKSLLEFCQKVDPRKVNKRVIEGLIKSGAFDSTGGKRSQLMNVLESSMEGGSQTYKERKEGQEALFSSDAGSDDTGDAQFSRLPQVPEWDDLQISRFEKEALGFYITCHPLSRYVSAIKSVTAITTDSLAEIPDGRDIKICGIIGSKKITMTKKGDRMAYLNLEDLQGTVEVIVFPELFKNVSSLLSTDAPLLISGFLDKAEKGNRIKAMKVESFVDMQMSRIRRVEIRLDGTAASPQTLEALKSILHQHKGRCQVHLKLRLADASCATVEVDPDFHVQPSEALIQEIEQSLGRGTVTVS